jgi:Domain of unknown function (DUF4136)
MRTLLTLLLFAAVTDSQVEYDRQVDFSRYQTWSWHERVTRATSPVADQRIREAIERGLAARGLSRVDRNGTLLVVYHASKTIEINLAPIKNAVASTPTGIQYVEKGSVVVDMLDAASGEVVWRGHATGALKYGPSEVAEQIKAAVDKLLEKFPPPARRAIP